MLAWMALAVGMAADTSWLLSKRSGSIQVYHRPIAGWSVDEFRGEGVDSVPIGAAFLALSDLPAYPQWIDYLAESRVVQSSGVDTLWVYQRYDLPWPFDDRDIVVHVVLHRDYAQGLLGATMHSSAKPVIPVPAGCIRIPRMEGEIEMRYLGPSLTRGRFTERLELGGSVPAWLNGLFSKEIPYTILTNLRGHCRKAKYWQAAPNSVEQKSMEEAMP